MSLFVSRPRNVNSALLRPETSCGNIQGEMRASCTRCSAAWEAGVGQRQQKIHRHKRPKLNACKATL